MITSLYACLLTFIYLISTVLVIRRRRKLRVGVGAGGDHELKSLIGAHENLQNYFPLFLLLTLLIEMQAPWRSVALHIFGVLFVLGRVSHLYGMAKAELKKEPVFLWRMMGMMATLTSLTCLALFNAYLFFYLRISM